MDPAPPPATPATARPFNLVTFNLHAGVDGWGRPFDVVAACRGLDADVLVLEESWHPDGAPGLAAEVADALGYTCCEHALAGGRRAAPDPGANERWMRAFDWRGSSHAIFLDSHLPFSGSIATSPRYLSASPGTWGIAVLSRFPVLGHQVVDLGRLRRDRASRAALVVRVEVDGRPLAVVGTHMTHLSYGSPLHFLRLHRLLTEVLEPGPAVVAGDMNLWGPPVSAFMRGWRRAVVAKTWPAWRPHSQVDHVLVRGAVTSLGGEALPTAGSDHLPLRARLVLG